LPAFQKDLFCLDFFDYSAKVPNLLETKGFEKSSLSGLFQEEEEMRLASFKVLEQSCYMQI